MSNESNSSREYRPVLDLKCLQLAIYLARELISLGDEPDELGGKCARVQFKLGVWPDEKDGGGMNEVALATFLSSRLRDRPDLIAELSRATGGKP